MQPKEQPTTNEAPSRTLQAFSSRFTIQVISTREPSKTSSKAMVIESTRMVHYQRQ